MKKGLMIFGIILGLTSCSIVGGTVGAAGSIIGGTISAGGKIIGSLIDNKDGEIKAKDAKYKFSKAEIITEEGITTVTGELTHNGSTKSNLTIEIPCFDKNGVKLGDATDSIETLEKGNIWKFNARLNNGDVKTCKINDTYIFQDIY